jgi:lipid A oxidase
MTAAWFGSGARSARSISARRWGATSVCATATRFDQVAALLGLASVAALSAALIIDVETSGGATTASAAVPVLHATSGSARNPSRSSDPAGYSPAPWSRAGLLSGDRMAGAYGGVSYTHASTVKITNPTSARGLTDLSVSGFGWEGQPFKHPVYYGLRTVAWPAASRFGAMLDFTHAKAIARPTDIATFQGTLNGIAMPPSAPVRDVFKHLEFSHGHNIVTLNGLVGFGVGLPKLRPYAGAGAGISLPHTEIGYRGENGRTYEYQYAGVVGQALAGLEVKLGRTSVFFEYKFSYAPYDVPLSGTVNGGFLVTDLWRQFRAWSTGQAPPDGGLRTTLGTHHAIAGALVRIGSP